ncbi:MAG: hypothetical protein AAGD05_00075 [Bacteroidota bacterium]
MHRLTLHQKIVEHALQILLEQEQHTQASISQKLKVLGFEVSRATLSNAKSGQRKVSPKKMKQMAQGLQALLRREFCLDFVAEKQMFERLAPTECQPQPIIIASPQPISKTPRSGLGYQIHEGRPAVHQKVAFYQNAKTEIIEIGLRLRNFKNYFKDKRDSAFSLPLQQLLENGVHFKCYILNPEGNLAERYLADRALIQITEKETFKSLPKISEALQQQFLRINQAGYPGKMKLYYYDHFPYFHASVVDGAQENGHMLLAPYLYGLTRANTPVIEINRRQNPTLFKKYWRSVTAMIQSPQVIQLI